MNKVMLLDKVGNPFVTKKGKYYYIRNHKFIGEESLILDAIAQVKEVTFNELTNAQDIDNKEDYWKRAFNFEWTSGGLILWYNVKEYWSHELCRRGELNCKECGGKTVMYYTPYCPICEPIKKVNGYFNFIKMQTYVNAKYGKVPHSFWQNVFLNYFEEKGWGGNDQTTTVNFKEVYERCKGSEKKYGQLFLDEYGTKTYPVLISW